MSNPIRANPSVEAALPELEKLQLLRIIANHFGANLPKIIIIVTSINERITKLQQNLQNAGMAVEILADPWITLEKVYVYPPSLDGSEEITKFAAIIRSRLASQLNEVSHPVQSKFLLRGEYLVAGRET